MDTRRAEHEVVLTCVRRSIPAAARVPMEGLLEGELDWDYCLGIADRHQILPMLQASLMATAAPAAPSGALRALGARLLIARRRSRKLTGELVRLSHLATAAGLAMLWFKGPALAAMIYGDLEARQYDDLDVLVDGAAVTTTEAFLVSQGYRRTTDHGWQATFLHDTTGVSVDLHRQLTFRDFPVPFAFDRLWARREVVMVAGQPIDTFNLEDLLIVLCVQVARDALRGRTKLAKLCDIAQVIFTSDHIDWERVRGEARRLRVERVLQFALLLTARIFDIALPEPAHGVAGDRALTRLLREEEEALFTDVPDRGPLFHLQIREHWRDRLYPYYRNLSRYLMPNASDRHMISLPQSLSVLYYVLRPLRLIRRYGRYFVRNAQT
jgi:putative nucleotidyltransferase-like protein